MPATRPATPRRKSPAGEPIAPTDQEAARESAYRSLRRILEPYERHLVSKPYRPEHDTYYLESRVPRANGQPLFFGSVGRMKQYVSYHLMPVYSDPDLLEGLSPELRKRMHGKSCFNFRSVEPDVVTELTELTRRGFERWRGAGWV